MAEESIFFLPVGEVGRREVVTCAPEDRLVDVAETMRRRNISSVVVCEGGSPTGIVTDRDLRNKVVSRGEDPRTLTVRSVMNSPLIVVGEDDFLFEVLYRMSRHGVHRVGVVDADGRLTGIVTDSDIIRLQTRSPHQMVREIEEAGSVEELKGLHDRVQELVLHLTGAGVRTQEMVRLISYLNDRILLRAIALLREERFADLPEGFAFIVLGSEGRREQTLTTDQDNALICADGLSGAELERLRDFSCALIDALVAIGIPPCAGGIMARNDPWRRSLGEWKQVVNHWLNVATPENILRGSMFFDLRTLYGDPELERALKAHVAARLPRESSFLARMAGNVLNFRPPLGLFGRIKVERKGEYRGLLDVKKAGLFAITEGVKALALASGVLDGGTTERIRALAEANILSRQEAEDLEASFNMLLFIRLRGQVEAVRAGRTPTNYIALEHLNRMEKGRLRIALEGVDAFLGFLRRHFGLSFTQ